MNIDIFTLFPGWFDWFLRPAPRQKRAPPRATTCGCSTTATRRRCRTARSTTPLMAAAPGWSCAWTSWTRPCGRSTATRTPCSPTRRRGAPARRAAVRRRAGRGVRRARALTLLCGRYEGIDERVRDQLANDAVSIGPYVLSGGELAAMVVADAVIRKLPGALGDERSAVEESFWRRWGAAPEYPHTRAPPAYRGWEVPEVLLSGHHEQIRNWRLRGRRAEAAGTAELSTAADGLLGAGGGSANITRSRRVIAAHAARAARPRLADERADPNRRAPPGRASCPRSGSATACGSTFRSWRAPAAARRSSRESC